MISQSDEESGSSGPPVVGPRLRRLLIGVLLLFALLSVNSIYLGAITLIEWQSGVILQNYFYQWMFLGHLVLGLLLVVPAIAYGVIHMRNAYDRPNRPAVNAGIALFAATLILLCSGLLLTRGFPWVELKAPNSREFAYWLHVMAPFVLVWLFLLHRLAGPAIRWRSGAYVILVAGLLTLVSVIAQTQDPRRLQAAGPEAGEQYFSPSLARTADGQFISARSLMMDGYCQECHQDVHQSWAHSMHRFASFNNPAYLFSVRKTREFLNERDGTDVAVRFCAGCHDPVPFFSGAMEREDFDDTLDHTAQAGITCSACHAITSIDSPRGNADYTIAEPLHYPFAYSEQPWLKWINRTLVKAKPAFHNKSFLKPLHKTPEFCGTCHKVHLPEELNDYRWLRGQDHYDSFLLSGVSGHGIRSFYYPAEAEVNCQACHMPLTPSADFGARRFESAADLSVHDHQFRAANTAIPHMLGLPTWVNDRHTDMLRGALRVDIFGIREAGRIDGKLYAPLDSGGARLVPGRSYLIEIVIRNLNVGHAFTQGTADSNEAWLKLVVSENGETVGESGALREPHSAVDPWAHFVNAFVIDRSGKRIDRRNVESIFTQLYDNQISPGAADVVHYLLSVPDTQQGPLDIAVSLQYRKFDTRFMQYIEGDEFDGNDLPITVIAEDQLRLPVAEDDTGVAQDDDPTPTWQRWNDYGIGLLRRGQLRQAEEAFMFVDAAGRGQGALNLARVYLREGRLDEAAAALLRAAQAVAPAPQWSISYFTAQLNLQNGYFDDAIAAFRNLIATRFEDARRRGFDFSKDYRLLNDLALALAERAKIERGPENAEQAVQYRREAVSWFLKTLELDPENITAHYGLAQLFEQLGDAESADRHRELHARYKIDDNARDRAVQLARRLHPPANQAANEVVIYELKVSPRTSTPPEA